MTVVTSVSGCPRCRSAVTIVSTWPTLVTYWNCGSCGAAAAATCRGTWCRIMSDPAAARDPEALQAAAGVVDG